MVQPPIRMMPPAVEGAAHVGEVGHPDQSLSAEDQLLPAPTQRHIGVLAERNHDVREAVQEVQLAEPQRLNCILWLSGLTYP